MFAPIIGFVLATISPGPGTAVNPGPIELGRIATWIRSTERQRISLWTNRDEDPYSRGEQARVYFKAETDGYITVVRVDTDGRIRVLFPREPWEDNFARGGRTFEVLDRDDRAFTIDDYPGVGYVFAVSSPDPFRYDEFVRGDHWDYRLIAEGRVRGDPYVSLTEFASRIAGPGEYDYDIVPYYVEEHYDYPRFVCYDCHSYVSYSYWNPYHYSCNRFRIVVYDDYYYYPYRYYRGRNVVIVRPYRPGPRYVFKDHDGRGQYVTRVRQRPSDEGRRGVTERDRTSADVGGRGSVPAPVEPRGRRTADGGQAQDGQGRDNPDSPRRRNEGESGSGQRPGNPGTVNPRRETGTEGSRPNIVPRDNNSTRDESTRRREPESNRDLRPVDPDGPKVLPPDRRTEPAREEPRREEPRREEPRREEPRREEPRRSDPGRSEPRAEPRRSEPSRAEPPRSEPRREPPRAEPRRSDPPPQARPQPTGDPQLRRRKPE